MNESKTTRFQSNETNTWTNTNRIVCIACIKNICHWLLKKKRVRDVLPLANGNAKSQYFDFSSIMTYFHKNILYAVCYYRSTLWRVPSIGLCAEVMVEKCLTHNPFESIKVWHVIRESEKMCIYTTITSVEVRLRGEYKIEWVSEWAFLHVCLCVVKSIMAFVKTERNWMFTRNS